MSIAVKKIFTNNNSVYIIDENDDLYVSGNNKNGRLGVNSSKDFIRKIQKIENPELENNVKAIILSENVSESYELVCLVTKTDEKYICGNLGDRIIPSWRNVEDVLHQGLGRAAAVSFDNTHQQNHFIEMVVDENETYLFTIKPERNIFSLLLKLVSVTDIIETRINCMNASNDFFFTEYAITTKKGFDFIIKKLENGERDVFIKINPDKNEYNSTNIKEILKIDVDNIFFKIYYLDEEELENREYINTQEKNYLPNKAEFDGDNSQLVIDSISTEDNMNMITIDAKIKDKKEEDLPFEDETFKDPCWMYTIFNEMGLEYGKIYKFEGTLNKDGLVYSICGVRIYTPIITTPENAKIGVIQFIYSEYQKLEEFDIVDDGEDHSTRLNGLTFYPTVVDQTATNDSEYIEYKLHDSVNKDDYEKTTMSNNDYELSLESIVYELKGVLCGKDLNPKSFSQPFVTK